MVVQMVKNLPAMRETWVQSLDWKDPLEKGKASHSSILAQRIPWTILYVVVCICQSQPPNSSLPYLSSLVNISLFSISVTLFLFYKLVHLYHFLRFC